MGKQFRLKWHFFPKKTSVSNITIILSNIINVFESAILAGQCNFNEIESRFFQVFLDRRCLPKGKRFPDEINQQLAKTEVGIVVVTPEFFTRKWPMTELVSFMKSQDKNPDVRILPLFYKMPVSDVRVNLQQGLWEEAWTRVFGDGKHQIVPGDCRAAVQRLCDVNGIEYHANSLGHDREYIKSVVAEVAKIVREGMWKR